MKPLHWGILSTGGIARRFAKALQTSTTGTLSAVASRDAAKAVAFAGEFEGVRSFGSYEELLADPAIEAIYVAIPHPMHAEWSIRAAQAGKHILCEKPATVNAAEMEKILEAVKANGVFFMEAFMYRCHPQTAKLIKLIRSGEIGEVRIIRCVFSFHADYVQGHRLFANDLGGGGILDVGSYCVSMSRLIAGVATGGEIAEPTTVKGLGRLHPAEKTDLYATALLHFPGDIIAELSTGVELQRENIVTIEGLKGSIRVTHPWFAGDKGAKIIVQLNGEKNAREIATEIDADLYGHEIDLVAQYQNEGQAPFPAMTWSDTLGNMKVLDAWRDEIGLIYESEKA